MTSEYVLNKTHRLQWTQPQAGIIELLQLILDIASGQLFESCKFLHLSSEMQEIPDFQI